MIKKNFETSSYTHESIKYLIEEKTKLKKNSKVFKWKMDMMTMRFIPVAQAQNLCYELPKSLEKTVNLHQIVIVAYTSDDGSKSMKPIYIIMKICQLNIHGIIENIVCRLSIHSSKDVKFDFIPLNSTRNFVSTTLK